MIKLADIERIKTPFGLFWLLSIGFLWLFWAILPGNVFAWLWGAAVWTIVGFLLLPAALIDTVSQQSVQLQAEPGKINGQDFSIYRAETPEQWQHGFKKHDVQENEAMLFVFPDSGLKTFWMKDTLIPLDIAFFAADGSLVGLIEMEPCEEGPCSHYSPDGPYRYALETERGGFAGIEDLRLEF